MKLTFSLFIIYVLSLNFAFAQITFERQYGNHSTYQGSAWIEQTFDGGYIIAGSADNFPPGTGLPLLLKIDMYGDSVWFHELWGQATWWGTQGLFYVVHQLPDSGFIVGGGRNQNGRHDFLIARTNIFGDTIWTKLIEDSSRTDCKSITLTSDGGFISYALVQDYYKIYKFDSSGNIVINKKFNFGLPIDMSNKIQETSDNGFALFGTTKDSLNSNSIHLFMAKFDSSGDSLWVKKYGSNSSFCYAGQQTADGGYILCGTDYINSVRNIFLVKTDTIGDTLWTHYYGGTGIDDADGYSIRQTQDQGYIICGGIDSLGTGSLNMRDLLLVRTDSLGNQIFSKSFKRLDSQAGVCVQQTSDGGFITCGSTSDNNYAISDIYVVKTNEFGNLITDISETNISKIKTNFYPNPCNDHFTINLNEQVPITEILITNSFGQEVSKEIYKNTTTVIIKLNGETGIYFVRVKTRNRIEVYKVIKL